MTEVNANFYVESLDNWKETNSLFGVIPTFHAPLKSTLLIYGVFGTLMISLGLLIGLPILLSAVAFLLIAEHRRVWLVREVVLTSCVMDEIAWGTEIDGWGLIGLHPEHPESQILPSDREDIFFDNLVYAPSFHRHNYIRTQWIELTALGISLFLLSTILPWIL
jgi:hypothetical protein